MIGWNQSRGGVLALFVAMTVICIAPPTQAADPLGDSGVFNAVAYKPLPHDRPIAVRPLDNSDANLAVQRAFEQQLRAIGYDVRPDALLVLSFETRDEIGAWSDDGRRTVLELQGRSGGNDDSASARFNLFDSARGGIMNEGRNSGTSIVTPSQYRLDVSIDDKQSGERIWQAWAIAEQRANSNALTKAMVPGVVRNLGATVKNQVMDLY